MQALIYLYKTTKHVKKIISIHYMATIIHGSNCAGMQFAIPRVKLRELLNSRAWKSDFVLTVHLYVFTYERVVSRYRMDVERRFPIGFREFRDVHQNPIEFPRNAILTVSKYFIEGLLPPSLLLSPRRSSDEISSGSRKMKWSAYMSAKPLTSDIDHDDEHESILCAPFHKLILECAFSPRTIYCVRADLYKKISAGALLNILNIIFLM